MINNKQLSFLNKVQFGNHAEYLFQHAWIMSNYFLQNVLLLCYFVHDTWPVLFSIDGKTDNYCYPESWLEHDQQAGINEIYFPMVYVGTTAAGKQVVEWIANPVCILINRQRSIPNFPFIFLWYNPIFIYCSCSAKSYHCHHVVMQHSSCALMCSMNILPKCVQQMFIMISTFYVLGMYVHVQKYLSQCIYLISVFIAT